MHLIVERNALNDALARAGRLAATRDVIPILKNIKLVVTGQHLIVTGTDLGMLAEETIAAEVKTKGAVTVQARVFHDLVRRMPEGAQVRIEQDGDAIMIASGRTRSRLLTLPVEDYPDVFGNSGEGVTFAIAAKPLATLLKKTAFAISDDPTRPYIGGIYLHVADKMLCAVATNGHSLARCKVPLPKDAKGLPGVIIPQDLIGEIERLAAAVAEDTDLVFTVSAKTIAVEAGNHRLQSKLIDGTFPDYERVIPQPGSHVATLHGAELLSACERCGALAMLNGEKKTFDRAIKLSFADGALKVVKDNHQLGTTQSEIEIEYSGEALQIGVNHEYMEAILRAADAERVTLDMSDPGSAIMIRVPSDESVTFVLMPTRVS